MITKSVMYSRRSNQITFRLSVIVLKPDVCNVK